jgi:hypothetical protein
MGATVDRHDRLEEWLAPFRLLFTQPTWQRLLVLVAGAILTTHRRTVAAALRVTGRGEDTGFSRYHDVLSRSRWSALAGAGLLLGWLVAMFVSAGPVVIGLDDTIERRWGAKIAARGIYRDPVRSSHGHFVKASGLRWLSAMLLVPVPWARRVWALPFLTVLMPSQRWADKRGVRHKSLVDGARQMLLQVARWLPDRRIVTVADSGFFAIDLLDAVRAHVCVVTRLRLDARLFAPALQRRPGTRGRPRRTGERLPTLAQRLADPATPWSTQIVADWYGQGERRVELATGCAVWSHPGRPVVPLRWLIVRDPAGRSRPQAFLSTDPDADPADMLAWFIRRWSIEVTFAEVRRHLGVETQRQWTDRAIARTTPMLLALFSLVTLFADDIHKTRTIVVRSARWYSKETITFSDALAAVRRQLWTDQTFAMSRHDPDPQKSPDAIVDRLIDLACYAA